MLRASVGTTLLTTTAVTWPARGRGARAGRRATSPSSSPVNRSSVWIRKSATSSLAVEDPDDDVGVPDVDREQHGGECRHHRPVIALLDIGGTKIAASAGRGAAIGTVRRIPTPVESPLATLRGLIEGVMGGVLPEAIAISAPGPFDRATGRAAQPAGHARLVARARDGAPARPALRLPGRRRERRQLRGARRGPPRRRRGPPDRRVLDGLDRDRLRRRPRRPDRRRQARHRGRPHGALAGVARRPALPLRRRRLPRGARQRARDRAALRRRRRAPERSGRLGRGRPLDRARHRQRHRPARPRRGHLRRRRLRELGPVRAVAVRDGRSATCASSRARRSPAAPSARIDPCSAHCSSPRTTARIRRDC